MQRVRGRIVRKMYGGVPTPIFIRHVFVNPIDARALWREIARLSDRRQILPYDDPSEPVLDFLRFLAAEAAIERQVNEGLNVKFRPMKARLDTVTDPRKRPAAFEQELEAYRKTAEVFLDAHETYKDTVGEKDVVGEGTADAINRLVEDDHGRFPKNSQTLTTGDLIDWLGIGTQYSRYVSKAKASLDLTKIDPDDQFPGEGLPSDWE